MRIGLLLAPGCFDSAVTILLDAIAAADRLRRLVDPAIAPLATATFAPRATLRTGHGLTLVPDHRAEDADAVRALDLLVVPGLGALTPVALADRLAARGTRALRPAVTAAAEHGIPLAAACTGTFVLGAAGALDGRRATTTWWLADEFRRRHPDTELDLARAVVHSGPVTTAGAAFAHVDLAMSIVSRVSPALADATARHLLVDARPALGVETVVGHLAAADALVSDFEDYVRAHLDAPLRIDDAAHAIGTTRRTLERRCRERTGASPHALVSRLRAERARHLRRTTELGLEQIAPLVGLRHPSTLRAVLRRAG